MSAPLDAERALVEQAFNLLAEAREGVDGFGAWDVADELHTLVARTRAEIDALLVKAEAPVKARQERARRKAARSAGLKIR
jgi:hypothetical protein